MSTRNNGNAQSLGAQQYQFQSGQEGQQALLPSTLTGPNAGQQNFASGLADPTLQAGLAMQQSSYAPSAGVDLSKMQTGLAAASGMVPPTSVSGQGMRGFGGSVRLPAQKFSSGFTGIQDGGSSAGNSLIALMQQLKG